jgi:6-phosphogluconolactonase
MRFLFGDERCVPPDNADSNYALVMRTLLAKGVPPGCSIARMEAENPDREAAARAYEELLPEAIDVLLLGVGADGHVASLFPHSPAFRAKQRTVVPVTGPKPPQERLTITPRVIAGAGEVFVLATGTEKGEMLVEALKSPADAESLPVRLALGGTWLLDEKAAAPLGVGSHGPGKARG